MPAGPVTSSRVTARAEFFNDKTSGAILARGFNFVVDAIDNVANKTQLIAACREHGFPRAGRRMGVPCVFSPEPPVYPKTEGTVCASRPEADEPEGSLKLNCEWGFGAATFVTGAFGFAAAGEVVRRLAGSGLA